MKPGNQSMRVIGDSSAMVLCLTLARLTTGELRQWPRFVPAGTVTP